MSVLEKWLVPHIFSKGSLQHLWSSRYLSRLKFCLWINFLCRDWNSLSMKSRYVGSLDVMRKYAYPTTSPVVVVKNVMGSMTSHENSQKVSLKKSPTCVIKNPSPDQRIRRTCLCASLLISSNFVWSCLSSSFLGSSSGVSARGIAFLTRSTIYSKQTKENQSLHICLVSTNLHSCNLALSTANVLLPPQSMLNVS